MNIRAYKKGDERQIVWLINNTWRDAYKDIFPSEIFDARDGSAEERIKGFENKLIDNNRICFVAEENEKIVGVMIGSFKTDIEELDKKNYARLIALYVDKSFQHHGIGKKLFDAFVDVLKQNKVNAFIIGVLEENLQARKAYEKWGGILTDYEEDFTIAGVSRKEVFYEYDINKIKS